MNSSGMARRSIKLTSRQFVIGVIAGLVAMGFIGYGIFGKSLLQPQVQADEVGRYRMPVNVVELIYSDSVRQKRRFTGMVRAKHRSDVGFEMSGKIVEILVEEGDRISSGAIIAKLDTETLKAQENRILAQIEQGEAFLTELNNGPRLETKQAAKATRDAAQSDLDFAKLNFERRKTLRDRGAISIEEFDQARFALRSAEANLTAAEERYELTKRTRQEKIDAQQASIRQLKASLEEIRVAISKSTLVSPFPGTITRRFADPGGIAQPSQPIVRLLDEEELEAWIGFPVSTASQLNLTDHVTIDVNGKPYEARLIAKVRELDQDTRTQTVIYRFDSADSNPPIVAGQLCDIEIEIDSELNGFWVPTTALAKGVRGLWSLMALTPDEDGMQIEKRDVEVILTETDRVLVKGLLKAGDKVVKDGIHKITNGQLVEPVTSEFVSVR